MATCLVTALFVGFVGCGSAAPGEEPGAVVGAGGQAAPVAAGGAGRAGAGGGIPGVMMSSVPCGTATCSGLMFMGMGAAACCADATTNACGTMQGGMCAAKPAVAELCPKIAPIFGMTINSCCQTDMTCGVDGSAVGMGCGPYSGLSRIPGAMVPPATMCDGTPIATPVGTAGSSAAGSSAAGSSAAGSSAAGSSAAGSSAAGSSAAGTSGAAGARAGSGGSTTSGAAGARAGAGGAAGR
jgi:hypothetical protein